MTKILRFITDYGSTFSHGLIAGILLVLTVHSGLVSG